MFVKLAWKQLSGTLFANKKCMMYFLQHTLTYLILPGMI